MKTRFLIIASAAFILASPAFAQQQQQQRSPSATAGQQLSQNAQEFVTSAGQGNMAEVLTATVALTKTSDRQVQSYAEMLIDQHTHSNMKLARLLTNGRVSFPTSPGQEHMQTLQRLQGMSGEQFDRAFLQAQIQAHQQNHDMFQRAAQSLQDEELKNFAQMSLPLLQAHLRIAQDLANQMGMGTTGSTSPGPASPARPGGQGQNPQ